MRDVAIDPGIYQSTLLDSQNNQSIGYCMKKLIILLLFISVNIANAAERIFFTTIPSYVTTEQAIASLQAAAMQRKWTVVKKEKNTLRMKLDHRGYKAVLEFYVSENGIYYSDFTTYYEEGEDDFGGVTEGEWVASAAPQRWIGYLKNDVNAYFPAIGVDTSVKEAESHEDIEKKLEGLKSLYEKQLITEEEYQSKRKEIISTY